MKRGTITATLLGLLHQNVVCGFFFCFTAFPYLERVVVCNAFSLSAATVMYIKESISINRRERERERERECVTWTGKEDFSRERSPSHS